MRTFSYTITDPVGIHARPAGMLAKKAKEFQSEIILEKGEKSANATRLMAVMGLCIKCGHNLNDGECGCDRSHRDPRWNALLGVKFAADAENEE